MATLWKEYYIRPSSPYFIVLAGSVKTLEVRILSFTEYHWCDFSIRLFQSHPIINLIQFFVWILCLTIAKSARYISGDFPVGDLCRSFLKVICLNVLMTAHSHAVKYGARHIFVAGTILNHPVVRSMAEVLYEERIPTAVFSLGQVSTIM